MRQGNAAITGSRDACRESFSKGLVGDGEGWMEMIRSRNQASHTYNQVVAEAMVALVIARYHALFVAFEQKMQQIALA